MCNLTVYCTHSSALYSGRGGTEIKLGNTGCKAGEFTPDDIPVHYRAAHTLTVTRKPICMILDSGRLGRNPHKPA